MNITPAVRPQLQTAPIISTKQNETNENGAVIVLSTPCYKKYHWLFFTWRRRPFRKGGGNFGIEAGGDGGVTLRATQCWSLEEVTIRLMGKRAVMSSHGGKKHLCLALFSKCKGEGDLMTFICSLTQFYDSNPSPD